MSIDTFTFRPSIQPDPDKPVEFTLRPADNPTLFRLIKAYGSDTGIEFADCTHVLDRFIVGWTGLEQEYQPSTKRSLLTGEGNYDALLLVSQCVRELYERAVLRGKERKNS